MSPHPAPALALEGITVRYGHDVAVDNVSFSVGGGEVVALIGPNGAGKSSLYKAILGLVRHDGVVAMHGTACHHRTARWNVAYLPQRTDVDLGFPITVAEVVLTGRRRFLRAHRWPRSEDWATVSEALVRVGLPGFERRPIGALSGGELQRVYLARALAQEADVLLLDEALAGVDRPNTRALLDLLDDLAADGAAVLVATHDLALARRRFGRCLAVNRRLVADGPATVTLQEAQLEAVFGTLGETDPALEGAA